MPTVIMLDDPTHTIENPECNVVDCICHAEQQAELPSTPSYEEQYYCGLCGRMREISHFPH